jgi:histidyl-tRNA synthetase
MEAFFGYSFRELEAKVPCQGTEELRALYQLLKETGISEYVAFDPTVLRGMDYYTGTVFEIYDTSPENRRAMFGGGRYDNLLGLFGNHKLSGVGFGMGDVGLRNFLEVHGLLAPLGPPVDVFVSLPKAEYRSLAEKIAGELRTRGVRVVTPLEIGGFGAQLKLATKHGARLAVLFGDSELAEGKVIVKDLVKGEQVLLSLASAGEAIVGMLKA